MGKPLIYSTTITRFFAQFLPDLLTALEFTGISTTMQVLLAIEVLKQMDTEARHKLPTAGLRCL